SSAPHTPPRRTTEDAGSHFSAPLMSTPQSAPVAGGAIGGGGGQKPKQGATRTMSTMMGSLDPLVVAGVAVYVATAYAFWGIFREYFDWTESL
ncbi:unnamed protein product, partial [Ectocarpus sp. 8 AP-2014]